jgi:hypothetical protein
MVTRTEVKVYLKFDGDIHIGAAPIVGVNTFLGDKESHAEGARYSHCKRCIRPIFGSERANLTSLRAISIERWVLEA